MFANQRTDAGDGLALGESAPDLLLTNDERQTVRLSDLWQQRPLVLLFVRHFG
jgi:peroxiredoxin